MSDRDIERAQKELARKRAEEQERRRKEEAEFRQRKEDPTKTTEWEKDK